MAGYKSPPDLSIAGNGGIAQYVDTFLAKRGVQDGYKKFRALRSYKHIADGSKAKELGIVTATYRHWEELDDQ